MNEKVLFHFIAEKIYLSHNNIMQQHLLHKYSFQRVPNQVEKLRKFQGRGEGYDKQKWGVYKAKVPSVGQGGGGLSIFSRTAYTCRYTCWWFYVTVVYRYLQCRPVTTSAYERLVSSSWQRQYYHYYYYYYSNNKQILFIVKNMYTIYINRSSKN